MTVHTDTFIDVGHYQVHKAGQRVGGDVFIFQRHEDSERVVAVLSDGLGSGIKASVLATLTSTMASRFVTSYRDIKSTANIIMQTLPVCKERKISFSTFTIVDIEKDGTARIIEYGNPATIFFQADTIGPLKKEQVPVESAHTHERHVSSGSCVLACGDRLIMFSDGVTQAGMGRADTPLGWGQAAAERFITACIKTQPTISARDLAKEIVSEAQRIDGNHARDDITCGVIYFRRPRATLLISGPPINPERDAVLAGRVEAFGGECIICGGTTANIIARELDRPIEVDLTCIDPHVPPPSRMPGVTLVTEGILTLCKVSELLQHGIVPEEYTDNAAGRVLAKLLNSDHIHFLIGTKINDVHQDPTMPVEIEIRRNIIKKIKQVLEEKHIKKIELEYI